jgi:hypothetical protein
MKKKIALDAEHGFVGVQKAKSKPKPYIEAEWIKEYRKERDRVIWKLHPESRQEIEDKYNL